VRAARKDAEREVNQPGREGREGLVEVQKEEGEEREGGEEEGDR
jgi:hypothetical protein